MRSWSSAARNSSGSTASAGMNSFGPRNGPPMNSNRPATLTPGTRAMSAAIEIGSGSMLLIWLCVTSTSAWAVATSLPRPAVNPCSTPNNTNALITEIMVSAALAGRRQIPAQISGRYFTRAPLRPRRRRLGGRHLAVGDVATLGVDRRQVHIIGTVGAHQRGELQADPVRIGEVHRADPGVLGEVRALRIRSVVVIDDPDLHAAIAQPLR